MPRIFFRRLIIFSVTVILVTSGRCQNINGIRTQWNDDFCHWDISVESGPTGTLRCRWPQQNDWTAWDYRIGEAHGNIKLKWSNNFNEWEIRGGNHIVTLRTIWRNNFREWKISNGKYTFTLKTKYGNTDEFWVLRSSEYGYFEMTTVWEGDFSRWDIVDEMDQGVPLALKMGMTFCVLVNSMPN